VNNAALAELALGRSSGLLANKSFPFYNSGFTFISRE
jgi:hypothetical protein